MNDEQREAIGLAFINASMVDETDIPSEEDLEQSSRQEIFLAGYAAGLSAMRDELNVFMS